MVPLTSLWLGIVLSTVLVFFISYVLHMVLTYHRSDFAGLPNEDSAMDGIRAMNIPAGDYVFPHAADPKVMNSPEFKAKAEKGPIGILTLYPGGWGMGSSLMQWAAYALVISVFVGYMTGRTLGAGAEYMAVFRVAGTVAFLGYAGAQPMASIWNKRKWSTTWKHMFDGFVYALLTAGCFAGFWPEA